MSEPRTIENDPVLYAIAVIESYQMDIRATGVSGDIIWGDGDRTTSPGDSLAANGFCQGSIYTRAIDRIKKMAGIA